MTRFCHLAPLSRLHRDVSDAVRLHKRALLFACIIIGFVS